MVVLNLDDLSNYAWLFCFFYGIFEYYAVGPSMGSLALLHNLSASFFCIVTILFMLVYAVDPR